MSWDRSWIFEKSNFTVEVFRTYVEKLLASLEDIRFEIEQEASDCITCFFSIHQNEETTKTVEISVYHMEGKRHVLSLEADASDNAELEIADRLVEDLADLLDGDPLEE